MSDAFCRCCKARRAAENLPPRPKILIFEPGAKRPTYVCEHCDGDVVTRARALENSRLADK